jgi:hypothetical protein
MKPWVMMASGVDIQHDHTPHALCHLHSMDNFLRYFLHSAGEAHLCGQVHSKMNR